MKQADRILDYLREFGSITALEAMRDLGIYRLGARIWELKRDGYAIRTEHIAAKNRYGETTHPCRYSLEVANAE